MISCTSLILLSFQAAPKISAPPETFFKLVPNQFQTQARNFYKKYVDVGGMPVVAAAEVDNRALIRTHEIVSRMLAGRPDVLATMVKNGMYLIIIGKDQKYTDMPEYSRAANPEYMNERVRGTGGKPTSFGEENLLSLPLDRYDDESIGVHEFCHTIDSTLRSMDPTWQDRRNAVYRKALEKGLWRNTYAGSNPGEFWAEICQSYFDCNRPNNWNHGPIVNREQLRTYDPESYELVRSVFRLRPEQDWRYKWLNPLPNVTKPAPRFGLNPYYTKFTWAREFVVVGRQASDQALLKANELIRRAFAYRHDVLKALIADGVKLVVLGAKENVNDLPEFKGKKLDVLSREVSYNAETKTLVVGEENVMDEANRPTVGGSAVLRVMAESAFVLTADRPEDPNWDKRGRDVQQYELRVTRLDERFGRTVRAAFAKAIEGGKWKGTTAIHSASAYWTKGFLAYFDAAGQDQAPADADHSIVTREQLEKYDPTLFQIVKEVMAYAGKTDWRYRP